MFDLGTFDQITFDASVVADVGISAVLNATENQDIAAFVGGVIVSGTLAVTEAPDIAAFTGTVTFAAGTIVGYLNATERADMARFVVAQPEALPGEIDYSLISRVVVRRKL